MQPDRLRIVVTTITPVNVAPIWPLACSIGLLMALAVAAIMYGYARTTGKQLEAWMPCAFVVAGGVIGVAAGSLL